MATMTEMVEAVRSDKIVGRNTCSCIDECLTDAELAEELTEAGAKSVEEAIAYARRSHDVFIEREEESRW